MTILNYKIHYYNKRDFSFCYNGEFIEVYNKKGLKINSILSTLLRVIDSSNGFFLEEIRPVDEQ